MLKKIALLLSILLFNVFSFSVCELQAYDYLKADGPTTIEENRTVNVVLIGIESGPGPENINSANLLSYLDKVSIWPMSKNDGTLFSPSTFSGLIARTRINYNIVYTDAAFENAFFAYLLSIAIPQQFPSSLARIDGSLVTTFPLNVTPYQALYDFQNNNPPFFYFVQNRRDFGVFVPPFQPFTPDSSDDIISQNYFIDAPSVEKYLASALPGLGLNPQQYTVILINWWGRPDFIDHVYTKDNEPDPHTGFNFGSLEPVVDLNIPLPPPLNTVPHIPMTSRKTVNAWGMTAHDDPEDCPSGGCNTKRIWFYDASVVEGWVGNWDITHAEPPLELKRSTPYRTLATHYRFPPIWEYGNAVPVNTIPYNLHTSSCEDNSYDAFIAPGFPEGYWKYRSFDNFSQDMAKLINDVFIANFVLPWPVYDPWFLGRPHHPERLQVDINVYNNTGDNINGLLDNNHVRQSLTALVPTGYNIDVEVNQLLFQDRAEQAYGTLNQYNLNNIVGYDNFCANFPRPIYEEILSPGYLSSAYYLVPNVPWLPPIVDILGHPGDSLYDERTFGMAFADLVLYQDDALFGDEKQYLKYQSIFHYPDLLPLPSDIQARDILHPAATGHGVLEGDQGAYGYEVPVFLYHLTEDLKNPILRGVADNNSADPKFFQQTFPFGFSTSTLTQIFSFDPLLTHEFGHHIGMSHPHDGAKCANAATDVACTEVVPLGFGDTYYCWHADESSSVMSYMNLNDDFSQSDQDAMARYLVAAYFHNNNRIYEELLNRRGTLPSSVRNLLSQADTLSRNTVVLLNSNDFDLAVTKGKAAHQKLLEAAEKCGLVIQSSDWRAPYRVPPDIRIKTRHYLDRLRVGGLAVDESPSMLRDAFGIDPESWEKTTHGRPLIPEEITEAGNH